MSNTAGTTCGAGAAFLAKHMSSPKLLNDYKFCVAHI